VTNLADDDGLELTFEDLYLVVLLEDHDEVAGGGNYIMMAADFLQVGML
jgi:hypothetical protein